MGGRAAQQVATTWNVSLSGIDAWQHTDCSSRAYYPYAKRAETITVGGQHADSADPSALWSFTAATPIRGWPSTYLPLSRITASCELTRHVYVGRRSYRSTAYLRRNGSAISSRRPNGCKVYSYSVGNVTIDCRRSRSSGSVSWRFGLRPSDLGGAASLNFDRLESTMGAHRLSSRRGRYSVTVTETVSPGTMITVTSVELRVRRLYSKKVWRDDSLTLNAAWPS